MVLKYHFSACSHTHTHAHTLANTHETVQSPLGARTNEYRPWKQLKCIWTLSTRTKQHGLASPWNVLIYILECCKMLTSRYRFWCNIKERCLLQIISCLRTAVHVRAKVHQKKAQVPQIPSGWLGLGISRGMREPCIRRGDCSVRQYKKEKINSFQRGKFSRKKELRPQQQQMGKSGQKRPK